MRLMVIFHLLHYILQIFGPEMEDGYCVNETLCTLDEALTVWDTRLAYNHPSLIAGEYRYQVSVLIGASRLESPDIRYTLKPFSFGV